MVEIGVPLKTWARVTEPKVNKDSLISPHSLEAVEEPSASIPTDVGGEAVDTAKVYQSDTRSSGSKIKQPKDSTRNGELILIPDEDVDDGAESVASDASNTQGRTPKKQSDSTGKEQRSTRNLYISGLPPETNDVILYNMLAIFGEIISAKAVMGKGTNPPLCKGFGFIMFRHPRDAAKAIDELTKQGHWVQFAKASPKRAPSRNQSQQDPTNLYFSNLPLDYTEANLESLLRPCGRVLSSRILRDTTTNASRGVGFARMQSHSTCEKVLKLLNGKSLEGHGEPLQCKYADTPSHRAESLRQHMGRGMIPEFAPVDYDMGPIYVPVMDSGLMPLYSIPYGPRDTLSSNSSDGSDSSSISMSPSPIMFQPTPTVQYVTPSRSNNIYVPPYMIPYSTKQVSPVTGRLAGGLHVTFP